MEVDAREETRAPLRLLSLDGGGVRGLSSLMILKQLMERIAAEEKRLRKRAQTDDRPLKPCEYFDLIGGTSTGGIISVLLGRLQLDVPTCIKIYTSLSEEIFKHDRCIQIFGMKLPVGKTRFSGEVLARSIKNTLKDLGFSEDELMWDDSLFEEDASEIDPEDSIWNDIDKAAVPAQHESPTSGRNGALVSPTGAAVAANPSVVREMNRLRHTARSDPTSLIRSTTWKLQRKTTMRKNPPTKGCHSFVVSALKNALGIPRLFTTFDANDHQTRIWEALRATSAAPTFFEEMTFGHPIKMTYLDGGLGFNNPCAEVDYAAKSIWQGRSIGIIVSIGTGLQTIPSVKKAPWTPFAVGTEVSVAAALAGMATSTARVDNEMQRMYYGTDTAYHRYDVDAGLDSVSLEQWMKEDQMGALTEIYMRDPEQVWRSKALAQTMVHLSAIPTRVEIAPKKFRIGVDGHALIRRDPRFPNLPCWLVEELDFKTGFPVGLHVPAMQVAQMEALRSGSPSGKAGMTVDDTGHLLRVFPVAEDLDGDGKKQEAAVITCIRADNICLRVLRTGIPQGRYIVKFIVSFFDLLREEDAKEDEDKPVNSAAARCFPSSAPGFPEGTFDSDEVAKLQVTDVDAPASDPSSESPPEVGDPSSLIFSAGKPYHSDTFLRRHVDVHITPDIVPALLHPHAVRVRVGPHRYHEKKGKGWFEVEGDVELEVGLDGTLGIVVNKRFKQGQFIGGWSFGGVRLVPVYENSIGRRGRGGGPD
ncbi:MAG: hypothetical protein M4579_006039 [Chaenotheca gracillima]|nr:MAG: hypothetical protein M4579_006039 [Chaenotheca gracillima]